MTDIQGNVTEYSYYNDNRLYEVTVKRPSQADRVFTYTYDAGGRLEKIVYPSSTGIEARFDDGAMTPNLMTVDAVAALRNDENAWPRRETGRKASFPSSLPTLRVGAAGSPGAGWNANGQLTNLRYLKDDGMSGFDNVLELEYEYDDAGNRTAMISTSGTADPVRWEYDYNWLNQLTSVKKKIGSGSLLTQRVYEYDESDNRTFMDDHVNSKTYRYLYDAADQISKVQVTSTFQSRTPGDFSDQETFTHDDDGNMTLRTDAATSDTIAYRWDDQDNLIRVAFDPADTKVLHTYDAGGIRKAKILDDETTTDSFYSGLPTLNEVETPAVGSPVEFNYLMGHQLMGFESGGDFFYLLTDGLTSVRIVVDGSGDEVAAYEYLEFGEKTKTGSGSSPKTFVGGLGVHDDLADTNLFYMRARHYDARLGRFVSKDAVSSPNRYAYAHGNPLSWVDTSGLFPESPQLRNRYRKLYTDWARNYHRAGAGLRPNSPGRGLSRLCHQMRIVSASVNSNMDFLQLLQALYVPNSAIRANPAYRTALDPSLMQTEAHRAFLPGMEGWASVYHDSDDTESRIQDQTHHLVAYLIAGYEFGLNADAFARAAERDNPGDRDLSYLAIRFGKRLADEEGLGGACEDAEGGKKYRGHWIKTLCDRLSWSKPGYLPE